MAKDDPRVEAYGAVDEANAALGEARHRAEVAADPQMTALFAAVQDRLFTVGGHLATPAGAKAKSALPALQPDWIADLERAIDAWDAELEPLRRFVIPGGAPLACALHAARTACRRAERRAVTLAHSEPVDPLVLAYLNRLSDFLFVAARMANKRAGVAEICWTPQS